MMSTDRQQYSLCRYRTPVNLAREPSGLSGLFGRWHWPTLTQSSYTSQNGRGTLAGAATLNDCPTFYSAARVAAFPRSDEPVCKCRIGMGRMAFHRIAVSTLPTDVSEAWTPY